MGSLEGSTCTTRCCWNSPSAPPPSTVGGYMAVNVGMGTDCLRAGAHLSVCVVGGVCALTSSEPTLRSPSSPSVRSELLPD
eukprot:scaffold569692_cov17-Prasinocladus_malaysianus.AAC.1